MDISKSMCKLVMPGKKSWDLTIDVHYKDLQDGLWQEMPYVAQ